MTEKTKERLNWVGFVVFSMIAMLSGLRLLANLLYYLLNK